jgi:two-component system, OmpR family, alkaline phosphatase synthesis response regulator PhoP
MNRILVIEDDAEILDNIGEVLEFQSFEALTTSDGFTGIELAKTELPDLVICDVVMPDFDGYSVLSELRQNEETATIPFIFLTGRSERAEVRFGMELGADDYLTKPFTNEELVRAIRSCLDRQALLERRYEAQQQEIALLKAQLQTLQELAGLSDALIQKLSQGLRQPICNMTIATHMLRQVPPGTDLERYILILEEECARGTSLLNEASSFQEYLNPSKMGLLRSKLRVEN